MLKTRFSAVTWMGLSLLGLAAIAPSANANVIIQIQEVGGNVVATGNGTINLTGLSFFTSSTFGGSVNPSNANVIVGPSSLTDLYSGPTSSLVMGAGASALASFSSGNHFGIEGNFLVDVPHGYTSGTSLSGSSTFSGKTFASLGLNPGTYTYSWSADSVTVQVGPSTPEPATAAMVVLGLGVVFWKRRATNV